MKWISVEDRLPPKDGTHFIAHKEKYTREDRKDGYTYTAVCFYRWDDDIHPDYMGDPEDAEEGDCITVPILYTAWNHKSLHDNFTHWQPLPEAPIKDKTPLADR